MQNATNELHNVFGLDSQRVWDTELAFQHLLAQEQADSKRTTERRLHSLGILPIELRAESLHDEFGRPTNSVVLNWEIEQARHKRKLVLFAQLYPMPDGKPCLHANDSRGARYWVPLSGHVATPEHLGNALRQLRDHIGKEVAVFPHGQAVRHFRNYGAEQELSLLAYPAVLVVPAQRGETKGSKTISAYLKRLEAESIHILREAVAEAENPVMLYSIGKDSGVMLHLARKAFYPSPPPMRFLHVDTRWKFQEMYLFRDYMVQSSGLDLLVHTNPQAIEKNINPFDHGSALHTDITKTEGLKQALNQHQFDVVFGGARRDEEKSRAKERIFSFRTPSHHWDPKNQRPELWNLYNTRKSAGESIRVFPLSNWTELDIWHYIFLEDIPVVSLYFAKTRPVVVRSGMIMLVDDDRCKLLPGEKIEKRQVRFRTLGCYPLTGAVDSTASTIEEIVLELVNTRSSERQGRRIDSDSAASMEKKKREGYF
jgi:sulfate adenylyltransferase subunit 2